MDFHPSAMQIRDVVVGVLDSQPDALPLAKTFVLVHGLGVSSLYFRQLAEHLAPHARVVAVDLPGFGRTTKPDRSLRVASFAMALEETIERLGLADVTLIGHSMGTQVVVEALARRPTLARAGVLIGPVVNNVERRSDRVVQRFLQAASKETLGSAVPSVLAFLRSGPRWFIRTFPAMVDYPIEERVAAVRRPLAVVAGQFDRLAPRPFLDLLAERAGGEASVHVVEGASHQVMVTHPDVVTEICCRLAGVPTP